MTAPPPLDIAPLVHDDRDRVATILRDAGNFRDEEIDVALELFDAALDGDDYEFMGAFLAAADAGAPIGTPAPRAPRRAQANDERPRAGGALVAFACYGPSLGTDRTFDLYWIAVDPRVQGAGCGSRLLSEVERRLEVLHARMLVVETSSRSDYTRTRDFYVRRGYVEAARVREFYAPDDDRIILTKRIAGSPREGWGAVA